MFSMMFFMRVNILQLNKRFLFHLDKLHLSVSTTGYLVKTSLYFAPRDIPKYLMESLVKLQLKILDKIMLSLSSSRLTSSDLARLILSFEAT